MAKKRADGLRQKQVTIGGKRVVFYGHSERELLQKIRDYKEERSQGRTFKVVAEEWEEEHFPKLAYNTLKGYKPALREAIEHFDCRIKSIKPLDVQRYVDLFAKSGKAKKTVATRLLVMNLIMTHAVLMGDIEYNPCSAVKIPAGLKKERRELPTEEEINIVKNSLDKPFGLFAFFLLYTGCRRGEALALTYGDIDREKRIISVTKSVYYDNNKPKLKSPKSEAGNRDVVLLDVLASKLDARNPNEYIFPNKNGDLMIQSEFDRQWSLYCKESGLSITPHQLRHAYATILYEAGIKDKDAQELLGHAQISTTRDIYTHISQSRKESLASQLNAFIS